MSSPSQNPQRAASAGHRLSSSVATKNIKYIYIGGVDRHTIFEILNKIPRASNKASNNHGGPILRGQRRQSFAFSDKIMYYIAMNPASAVVYKKLVRTCKYFYILNPILVVRTLDLWENEFASCELLKDYVFDMREVPFKIWITECINVKFYCLIPTYVAATFVEEKLFRSNAAVIYLSFQVLTLDELLLLSSKAKKIDLVWCHIYENDGEDEVMFEKVIEKLPKLRELYWRCNYPYECFSANTVKELIKIPHFGDITSFHMEHIPDEFDVKALFDYVKKCKNMHVNLDYFHSGLNSVEVKKDVDNIIDEVLGTKVFTYKPPKIHRSGEPLTDKMKKMNELSDRYKNTRF